MRSGRWMPTVPRRGGPCWWGPSIGRAAVGDPVRLVTEPHRQIEEFMVFSTPVGWRAVHTADLSIVVEATDWDRLDLYCLAQRLALSVRRVSSELASWGRWHEDNTDTDNDTDREDPLMARRFDEPDEP